MDMPGILDPFKKVVIKYFRIHYYVVCDHVCTCSTVEIRQGYQIPRSWSYRHSTLWSCEPPCMRAGN